VSHAVVQWDLAVYWQLLLIPILGVPGSNIGSYASSTVFCSISLWSLQANCWDGAFRLARNSSLHSFLSPLLTFTDHPTV